jgi:arylsulfatase A-like enzyme
MACTLISREARKFGGSLTALRISPTSALACRARLAVTLLLLAATSHMGVGCADEVETGLDGESEIELTAPACDTLSLEDVPSDASFILVVNDAMRRDRAGVYGGPARTPRFDALAREGLLFSRAIAPAPWTKPSIAALFTSLYPSQHGVASDPELRGSFGVFRQEDLTRADVLPAEFVTLAERLRDAGFRTGALVANPWMRRPFGFDQGFDHYDDSFSSWDAPGSEVSRMALAWLDELDDGERFFLYLHYVDAHRPYGRLARNDLSVAESAADPRELSETAEKYFRHAIALEDGTPVVNAGAEPSVELLERAYDRGVENFDTALGSLLDGLARHPAWPRTGLMVTSDHGEALYERGYGNHGGGLFDDEAAVPLVARLPGVAPKRGRVDCMVSLVDVMPSLCAYLGLECEGDLQGVSLFGSPASSRRLLVTEGVMNRPSHRAVRGERWTLLYEPEGRRDGLQDRSAWSLYDVQDDPALRRDRLAGRPDAEATRVLAHLRQGLRDAVAEMPAPERRTAPVDPALAERLRELGYVED